MYRTGLPIRLPYVQDMTRIHIRTLGMALLIALSPIRALASGDAPAFLLVGLDGKTFFAPDGSRNGPNGSDAVGIIDASDEAHPRLIHTLLDNSVYGPPTNLRVTPDGRLGLVASSVLMHQDGTAWYAHADNRLHVIDLTATPPRLIETVEVGQQPSGISISRTGDLALIANREGRSVTILSILGSKVRPLATIDVGDEAAAVAFAANGRRAFVAKNKAARIGVLSINGTSVRYEPEYDMPVGAGFYGLDVTPDGTLALTGNTGQEPSDGHADTISVIRADGRRPVVLDHLGIGDTPEALVIAPDGRHAAVSIVRGSSAARGSPGYTPTGAVALLTLSSQSVQMTSQAETGVVTQGIAFSSSSDYVYVCNYVDRNLGIYRISGDTLIDTGNRLSLPGQPAFLAGR